MRYAGNLKSAGTLKRSIYAPARTMARFDVPVFIVGGGPVGLSASLLLSRHGIRSLLVERHATTSIHPKARALNVRTLELFRVWGIEADVRARALAFDGAPDVVWVTTLVGDETRRVPFGGPADRAPTDSPTTSVACMQYELEPVLLEAARSYGPQ
jgi:putative polyketide hydroxylase